MLSEVETSCKYLLAKDMNEYVVNLNMRHACIMRKR
jgi:hypothetical protein